VTPAGATAAARRAAAARRPVRARGRAAAAPAAPRVVPRVPRRKSGPALPARGRQLRRGRATLGARALAGLRALPDHGVVERLTRGRLWIGLIGCLLLGLVSMQVALLKLNAGIGRAVQQGANLERRNGELRAEISRLGSEERIQAMGAKLGLIMPDAGHVTYLAARPGQDAAAALQALRANRLGTAAAPPVQAQTPTPSTDQSGVGSSNQSAPSTDQSAPTTDQSAPVGSPTDQSGSGGQTATGAAGAPAAADPSAGAAGGTGAQG
jgi:cell division protein FtsL